MKGVLGIVLTGPQQLTDNQVNLRFLLHRNDHLACVLYFLGGLSVRGGTLERPEGPFDL